jgi:ribosomal protein L24E
MPSYNLLTGTKVQVYRGIAKQTAGGLTKKDIIRVKDSAGVARYKSKKQQQLGKSKKQSARSGWTKAYQKAIKLLKKEDSYYDTNILMFKPNKKYTGHSKQSIAKGQALYLKTRELFESKK